MARAFNNNAANRLTITNPTGLLDITGTAFTISAWCKPVATTDGIHMIVTKDGGTLTTVQYQLLVDAAGKINVAAGDAAGRDVAIGATVNTPGVWTHIVGVKDGVGAGTLRAYLNGVQDAAATSNRTIADTALDFCVGHRNAAGPYYGDLAEIVVWNVALTVPEIAALSKGSSPLFVRPRNIAAYFPLWGAGGSGAGEPDIMGNGWNLALIGSLGASDHAPVRRPIPV